MRSAEGISIQGRLALLIALVAVPLFLAAMPNGGGAQATPQAGAGRWWDDAVCYEIFVRSFVDSDGDGVGDLAGLTARLDYVNDGDPATNGDLGATCIWLMPIFEATSYHGYDVEDYEAIEADYGTMADFERFVAEAHARGIRVVLDLVLNHTSREHPWFRAAVADPASPYRLFYIFEETDPGYAGPLGRAWHPSPAGEGFYYAQFWEGMPDLNYRNPAVTAEAERISAFWIERGVDGFRLDAIKHLIEEGQEQENTAATHDWLRGYRDVLDESAPDVLTIGEIFNASAFMLDAYYPDQLHAYFQFEIAGQLLIAAEQGVGGGLAYAVGDALGRQPSQPWGTFLTNHDQTRAMTVLDGDVARAKLAATALMTLPGLPFVYYGEEIGMAGNKPDPRLRTPMQWQPGPGAGFTSGTPWEPPQDDADSVNVMGQEDDPSSLLNHYRALIQLHAAHPALGHGDFLPLTSGDQAVLAFLRVAEEERVLVVINFGDEPVEGLTLSIDESPLAFGAFGLDPVFGEGVATGLAVGEGGAFELAVPSVSPQSGHVLVVNS